MNLILIDPAEITDNRATLTDHRLQHIRKILKRGPGEKIRVGIINGNMGEAVIESISREQITLTVSADQPPPPAPMIDLVLALPRPIMLKRVLAQAASLGVGTLYLTNANRVEKSFFHASMVKEEDFLPFIKKGLEQAVDTRLPHVSLHHRFRPFVEDTLPELAARSCCLIAHPEGVESIFQVPPPQTGQRVLVAIGPEGGWVDFEVDKFKKIGFRQFSLGPRILRVDTAVPAILAQVNLLRHQ